MDSSLPALVPVAPYPIDRVLYDPGGDRPWWDSSGQSGDRVTVGRPDGRGGVLQQRGSGHGRRRGGGGRRRGVRVVARCCRALSLGDNEDLAEVGKTEDEATRQIRIDILDAEQEEVKMEAVDQLIELSKQREAATMQRLESKEEQLGQALAQLAAKEQELAEEREKRLALEQKDA